MSSRDWTTSSLNSVGLSIGREICCLFFPLLSISHTLSNLNTCRVLSFFLILILFLSHSSFSFAFISISLCFSLGFFPLSVPLHSLSLSFCHILFSRSSVSPVHLSPSITRFFLLSFFLSVSLSHPDAFSLFFFCVTFQHQSSFIKSGLRWAFKI